MSDKTIAESRDTKFKLFLSRSQMNDRKISSVGDIFSFYCATYYYFYYYYLLLETYSDIVTL